LTADQRHSPRRSAKTVAVCGANPRTEPATLSENKDRKNTSINQEEEPEEQEIQDLDEQMVVRAAGPSR
jgi:hypothetical protein